MRIPRVLSAEYIAFIPTPEWFNNLTLDLQEAYKDALRGLKVNEPDEQTLTRLIQVTNIEGLHLVASYAQQVLEDGLEKPIPAYVMKGLINRHKRILPEEPKVLYTVKPIEVLTPKDYNLVRSEYIKGLTNDMKKEYAASTVEYTVQFNSRAYECIQELLSFKGRTLTPKESIVVRDLLNRLHKVEGNEIILNMIKQMKRDNQLIETIEPWLAQGLVNRLNSTEQIRWECHG